MFASYPMFLHQYRHLTGRVFDTAPTEEQVKLLALGQSLMLFGIALLCTLIGFLYCERLKLPGLGRPREGVTWLVTGVAIGVLITPVSYFILDKGVMAAAPELFPRPWHWALAWMAGSVISQEVVARFGLLTVGIYLLDWLKLESRAPAVFLVSIFGLASAFLFITRLEIIGKLTPWQAGLSLASVFAMQWIYCEVFLRRGLLAAGAFHAGLSAKLIIYAAVL